MIGVIVACIASFSSGWYFKGRYDEYHKAKQKARSRSSYNQPIK